MLKLYFSPGACSLSPHIVLREAGVQFTTEAVDLKTKTAASGRGFDSITAKGYVPVLEFEDGQRLTEGPAIVQYVADLRPAKRLAPPARTIGRYRLQEWLNFITSEVHKQFYPLFRAEQCSADWQAAARAGLARRFDWMDSQLSGTEWVMGKEFTVADAYLFTVLNWTQFVDIDLGRWPALKSYVGRVRARPMVREALLAEGLIK